jgi:hypothetical protein
MSSVFNQNEVGNRTISFRAIILIMVYAGTILLNLLAAFVDDKFPIIGNMNLSNMTAIADGAIKVNIENIDEAVKVRKIQF